MARAALVPPYVHRFAAALMNRRPGLRSCLAACLIAISLGGLTGAMASADPIPTTSDLPTAPAADQSKYPEFAEAQQKANARDFEGALESLKAASAKHPELAPGEVLMADLLFSGLGNVQTQRQQIQLMQAARNYLEQAVVNHPKSPDAYVAFGELAVRDRRVTDAELLYTKAMSLVRALNDTQPRKQGLLRRCHAGLATVAENRADWATAETHLMAWLASDEDNAQAQFRLGRALFNSNNSDNRKRAYEVFKQASKLDDRLPPPELTVAQLFDQSANAADKKVATQWMDYAVKTAAGKPVPYQVATRLGVANWHWGRDEIDKAKEHAQAALETDPDSVNAKLMLGLIARYENDYAAAESIFGEVYRDAPDNITASTQLAICLADQGDAAKLQRALGLADSNARAQQNNLAAAAALGWVYFRLGRVEEAERLLSGVAAAGRPSAELMYYLANVLAERDRKDEALKLLKSTLDATGPQIYRDEAKALYAELSTGSASTTP